MMGSNKSRDVFALVYVTHPLRTSSSFSATVSSSNGGSKVTAVPDAIPCAQMDLCTDQPAFPTGATIRDTKARPNKSLDRSNRHRASHQSDPILSFVRVNRRWLGQLKREVA